MSNTKLELSSKYVVQEHKLQINSSGSFSKIHAHCLNQNRKAGWTKKWTSERYQIVRDVILRS